MTLRWQRAGAVCAVMLAAAVAAACGSGDNDDPEAPAGPPRAYQLGFSSLPRELNADSYADTIEFAGEHGELLLIQRMIPWEEFLPGSEVSQDLAENTAAEIDAIDDADLDVFFAIDPTDGSTARDRLGDLPADLTGRRFDDAAVRAAFLSYAEYIARNYAPAYMALGVEMNLYYERNQDDFENFKSLYNEAYARVKELSPETSITVTFQYEDLQGILPRADQHFASWHLVRAFEPNIDFVGISTYPSLVYAHPSQMPETYYSQLTAFTSKPVAIAEMGYASSGGTTNASETGEELQASFVERALIETEDLDMPFAVWFTIWDPGYARDTPFAIFQDMGLIRADDTRKLAWSTWEESLLRPYEASPAASAP